MDDEELLEEIRILSEQIDQCYTPRFTGLAFSLMEHSIRAVLRRFGREQGMEMLYALRAEERRKLERLTGPQPPL